jgi:hypothetical protein
VCSWLPRHRHLAAAPSIGGELSLSFNRLDLAADDGLTIFTYAPEPGSTSEDALKLLGSWAATAEHAEPVQANEQI